MGIKSLSCTESTEALFCYMPGIKVVLTPYNAKGLLIIHQDLDRCFSESTRLYCL
jgi:pyruvate/2-oxoglutarate/acetoin dehydrogenase E1 component